MNEYLLTFELSKDKDELHICTDLKGLEVLVDDLSALLKRSKASNTEHIHLFTEEWGGHELSSVSQIGEVLNHVKIICWNDEQLAEGAKILN